MYCLNMKNCRTIRIHWSTMPSTHSLFNINTKKGNTKIILKVKSMYIFLSFLSMQMWWDTYSLSKQIHEYTTSWWVWVCFIFLHMWGWDGFILGLKYMYHAKGLGTGSSIDVMMEGYSSGGYVCSMCSIRHAENSGMSYWQLKKIQRQLKKNIGKEKSG